MKKFITIAMLGIFSTTLAMATEQSVADSNENLRNDINRDASIVVGASAAGAVAIEARRLQLEGKLQNEARALHNTRIYTDSEAHYLSNARHLREEVARHNYEMQGNIKRQVELEAEHKRVLAEISAIEKKIQPMEVRKEISQRQREAIAIQMRIQQEMKPELIAAAEKDLKGTYAHIADLEHKISETSLRRDLRNRMQHSLALQTEQAALRKKDLEMSKSFAELKNRSQRLNQAASSIVRSHNIKAAPIAKKIETLLKEIALIRGPVRWGNIGIMGISGAAAVATGSKTLKLQSMHDAAAEYTDREKLDAQAGKPEHFIGPAK